MRGSSPRGEFAPPTLRPHELRRGLHHIAAPRGEFAPPTLRRPGSVRRGEGEGLRGANSPLLHCGLRPDPPGSARPLAPRGEFAPPTLRRRTPRKAEVHAGAPRGEFAPPTLRPPLVLPGGGFFGPPRGEFAPPTLRQVEAKLEKLLPSAPRGEFAPPTLRRDAYCHRGFLSIPPRGEFAPPTLRPRVSRSTARARDRLRGANSPLLHCGEINSGRKPSTATAPRGEFAPPTLRHDLVSVGAGGCAAPRGEFAPPTLRPPPFNAPLLSLLSSEGRIRPSYIAAT